MKFAIVGHSYVRHLQQVFPTHLTVDEVDFECSFFGYSGAKFRTLVANDRFISQLKTFDPDFVLVLLGGNDFSTQLSLTTVKEHCLEFYQKLRSWLPRTKIIASQIELRYYSDNNRFRCPTGVDYHYQRKYLNRFLYKLRFKDFLFRVDGNSRLDNKALYVDEVHLNTKGLEKLSDLIKSGLSYWLEHSK